MFIVLVAPDLMVTDHATLCW